MLRPRVICRWITRPTSRRKEHSVQASRELSPFEKAEAILDAPWMLEAGGTVMLMKILMSTDSRTVREHQTEFYKVLNEMCIAIFESSTQFEGAPEAVLGEFRDWLEETLSSFGYDAESIEDWVMNFRLEFYDY